MTLLAQLAKLPMVAPQQQKPVGMLRPQFSADEIATLQAQLANLRTDITEPPDPVITDPITPPSNPVIDGVPLEQIQLQDKYVTPTTEAPSAIIDGERDPIQDQLQELSNRPLTKDIDPSEYKSAEEFVKAQGKPLYHGTYGKFDKFMTPQEMPEKLAEEVLGQGQDTFGVYFTPKKELAQKFGSNIMERYLDMQKPLDLRGVKNFTELAKKLGIDTEKENSKLRNMESDSHFDEEGFKDDVYRPLERLIERYNLQDKIKDKYDGIIFNDREGSVSGETYITLDAKKIKTKQQLTDQWNNAQEKELAKRPIGEPNRQKSEGASKMSTDPSDYDSAEEYIESTQPKLNIKLDELIVPKHQQLNEYEAYDDTIMGMKKAIREGKKLPPISVYEQDGKYILNNGRHRYEAYKQVGVENIPIKIADDSGSVQSKEKKQQLTERWNKAQNIDPSLKREKQELVEQAIIAIEDIDMGTEKIAKNKFDKAMQSKMGKERVRTRKRLDGIMGRITKDDIKNADGLTKSEKIKLTEQWNKAQEKELSKRKEK